VKRKKKAFGRKQKKTRHGGSGNGKTSWFSFFHFDLVAFALFPFFCLTTSCCFWFVRLIPTEPQNPQALNPDPSTKKLLLFVKTKASHKSGLESRLNPE